MNNEGKRHARQKYVKKKVEEEKAAKAKYQGKGMSERSPPIVTKEQAKQPAPSKNQEHIKEGT